MTKILIDANNAVIEAVFGFKGSKALKDTFIASAKVNLADITGLTIKDGDDTVQVKNIKDANTVTDKTPKEIANAILFLQDNINSFVTKEGEDVEQFTVTVHKIEDKDDKKKVRKFESPTFYDKKKNEIVVENNIDETGKVRLVVYLGYNEDYERYFTRLNTAIIADPKKMIVHASNGVEDEDFDF